MSKFFTLTLAFASFAILAGCGVEADEKQPTDIAESSQAVGRGDRNEAPQPRPTNGRGEGNPSPTQGDVVEASERSANEGCGEDGRLCPEPVPPPSGGCGEGGRLCPTPAP